MAHSIISRVRKELKKQVDFEYRKGSRAFFKEKIDNYGVRTPMVRKISRTFYKDIADMPKKELFALAETMLTTNKFEETLIALAWADRRRADFVASDFAIFERWVKRYITNWATCDDFCGHALGYLLYKHPRLVAKTQKWTRSHNRWMRRASVVDLIYSVRREKQLQTIFRYSDALLAESDDLVQKGYGWALKEASNVYPDKVFEFVMQRKNRMPRTALRYAIEKMPRTWKNKAMEK